MVTSTDPTGGASAWTVTRLPGSVPVSLIALSCTGRSFCVGVGEGGDAGYLAVSRDPTGGSAAWTVSKIDSDVIQSVSCPSTYLCVALDVGGNALTSADPTGGSGSWTVTRAVDAGGSSTAISCPTNSRCVSVDRGLELR